MEDGGIQTIDIRKPNSPIFTYVRNTDSNPNHVYIVFAEFTEWLRPLCCLCAAKEGPYGMCI